MDREALVARNRRMARILHQPSARQRLRNGLCRMAAAIPVLSQKQTTGRLLIVRPDHLGDVLLSTPAIQFIKRAQPDTEIHLLCGPWSADLLANYREIDLVLTLPFPGFQRQAGPPKANPYRQILESARMLRKVGYDDAIIMRPDHWWGAMLAHLAGIPRRIGYSLDGVSPFLTERLRHQRLHAVEQNLRLAQAYAHASPASEIQLDFPVAPADNASVERMLIDWQFTGAKPIFCIHPGSGAMSKLWERDKWAATADALSEQFGAAIVITGTSNEMALVESIVGKMKESAIAMAGATSVGQLAALYRRARLVLGADNGAIHLAAAVNTPTVTLFGPADPGEFAPWGDSRRHAIVTSTIGCRPCRILDWRNDNPEFHPCVREISVDRLLRVARTVIDATSDNP